MTGSPAMDDGGRCLLDVISDPSALEYFLGSGNELKSDGHSEECVQVTSAQSKKELVSVTHQQFVNCGSNAISYTALAQPIATLQSTGQAIPNHAPVPSSISSFFQAPTPSPTAPSPISSVSKSPMLPPAQSPSPMSSRRSPAQLPIHSMPCPSPSGYPITQSPSAAQGIYQVRSPASSPLPTSFTTAPLNKVQTATSMAPATINILQQQHPQQQTIHVPATLSNSTTVTPTSAVLSGAPTLQHLQTGTIPVGGQIMQIIQAAPQSSTVRHHPSTMKPIQPKPQQILPKPAGGTSQTPYGKPVTLTQRTPVSLTPNQTSSLVIGQGQAVLPGTNVTVGPQGTLLLNHISLGVGQNPIILPGSAGLPPNVQLLVRPQPPSNSSTTSQSAASLTQPSSINNAAILAALHVQNQAALQVQNQAAQQAFLGQTKALSGQGQTVVIPGQNLAAAGQPQLSSANLRPNLIGGARMVNPTQAPLVLQQIQGPITVIQALQGHNVGVSSTGITLSNPAASAGISQLGSMLQGSAFQSAVAPSLQQSIVLNNQHPSVIATTSTGMPTLINHISDQASSGQIAHVTHLAPEQQSQQPSHHGVPQQQVSVTPPIPQQKPQSVNLEELLKQAGIMPEDTPPTPPPATSHMTVSVEPQSLATFAQMTTMPMVTSQCLPTVNGPQTVVVSQEHIPGQTAQSQLLAHLQQQPIVSSQLQTGTPIQTQVKLSVGQDGCVIIQRPVFQTQGPTLAISPSQQPLGSQPVAIPVASFSTATTTTTTTTTTSNATSTVPASPQPVQSVLLQRLSTAPHIQSPVTLQQPSQALGQPPQQLSSSQTNSATTSVIPVALQGISVNLVQGMPVVTSAAPPVTTTVLPLTTATSPQAMGASSPSISTTANTILSSMLSHSHPMLAQTLSQDSRIVTESIAVKPTTVSSSGGTFVSNGNRILHQSPLLVQSLQTVTSNVGPLTAVSVSSTNTSESSNRISLSSVVPSITQSSDTSAVTPASVSVAAVQTSAVSPAIASNVSFPKSSAPNVIFAGYPFPGLQPGQKVQTIQLTTQGQEALQKIQAQLRVLMQKPRTQQNCQQIQNLQNEQQKILSQGKVIAVQQQPIAQHNVQVNQQQLAHLQPGQQPRYFQQKAVNLQPTTACTNHASVNVTSLPKTSATSTSPVLTTPLLQGNAQMATLQVATTLSTTQAIITSATSPSVITTAAPTHLKIGNQLIAIAPQQPRASTHAKPLSPEQQQQILCQNQAKQALFLKLHHQKQQQQQQQPQSQQQQAQTVTVHTTQESPVIVNQNAQAVNFTGGILQIKTITPVVTHLKPVCPAVFSDQQNRGIKRPASTPVSRSALIQQQLSSDQSGVLNPNYKDPFASKEDACKRLLRYHVYNSRTPTVEDLQRADDLFETVSEQLIERAKSMFNKYRYLLLKESMKSNKTAEQVMLDRMFMQDESSSLESDRQTVKEGKELDLPPLPEHWVMVKSERDYVESSETDLFEEKFSASKDVPASNESASFDVALPIVKIKQEPINEVVMTYDDVSDDNSQLSVDCQGHEDNFIPSKSERVKNYDEWAEIQKELEMYPLESDEAGAGHIEFEPPDDSTTALADFEPPVPKVNRTEDGISGMDSGGVLHHSSHSHPNGIPPLLHQHHPQSQVQDLPLVKTHPMELMRNAEWGDALNVHVNNSIEEVSPCISSEDQEDSEEPITSLLVGHYRTSADNPNNLELADIDELDGHYGSVASDDGGGGGDEGSPSRTIPSSNHIGSCEDSSCDMVGLFETTFKPSSDISDVPNGSGDRSEDDDLNAQVQSAINSILNLQRIDDTCDAYVMRTVSGDNLTQVHLSANKDVAVEEEDDEEEEEEEEEEDEDEESCASGKNSSFTYDVVKHEEVTHEEDEVEEIDGMDYETAGVAAEMDGFTNDGPSEIDVALDEAVKSILL